MRDVTRISFLALASALALIGGGCSHTTPPSATARAKTARTLVNALTGNASGTRAQARSLKFQSDKLLVAKDYKGAMDKRLQILAPPKASFLGALTSYAIQPLALEDLGPIASHLDAPSCRKYTAQLQAIDARMPSYAAQLQKKKADELKDITLYTKDPQKWQQAIPQLGLSAHDQQILSQTPVSQIKANISALYDAEIKNAAGSYSSKPPYVAYDPYTVNFARPSGLARFLWTKAKTERVLTIVALQNRSDRLDKRASTGALPADPFGNGLLKRKGDVVYSIGPDVKDDSGAPISSSGRLTLSATGDVVAPNF